MKIPTLFTLLDEAASAQPATGIVYYAEGNLEEPQQISYYDLKQTSLSRAAQLQALPSISRGSLVLLHFVSHLDNISWFWAALLADCLPVLSPPLPNDPGQRKQHIRHLHELLGDPVCLTRAELSGAFADCPGPLRVHTIESLTAGPGTGWEGGRPPTPPPSALPHNAAVLMLTSGSTGNCKAAVLSHEQLFASVAGKATIAETPPGTAYLNWVGIDHVAGLVETHLAAMATKRDQVHAQSTDLVVDPLRLLELTHRHRVSRTFAPNSFLAALLRACRARTAAGTMPQLDLGCLRCLVSGGESNPVRTCEDVDALLRRLGAPSNVVTPGFGMTETCAGCIYNRTCPDEDLACGVEFASLGRCVPGIEVRVAAQGAPVPQGERGRLQVRGPIVTPGYYNNEAANAESFTADGWFDTGDEARLDSTGRLHIVGRFKEHARVNGVAVVAVDVEAALDAAEIPGAVPSFFACFPFRPKGAETEQLAVAYLPQYDTDDREARVRCNDAIVSAVMVQCGVSPHILPLDAAALQKSTLGKLSRGRIKSRYERGDFARSVEENQREEELHRQSDGEGEPAATDIEISLLALFRELLVAGASVDVHTPFFSAGISSMQLIAFKRSIETRLSIKNVPTLLLMSNPTVRSLAGALASKYCLDSDGRPLTPVDDARNNGSHSGASADEIFDPVVTLRTGGSKTPLWLFHPGLGEILVFLGLAQRMHDRPVYAIRARGFEPGETPHPTLASAVATYHAAVRRVQPHGPYALAGYSFGAMLAFETAKLLDADAAAEASPGVEFLGSFNLPPHIKTRMRALGWLECALHLAMFLDLVPPAAVDEMAAGLRGRPRAEAVAAVVERAPAGRMEELALGEAAFAHWADLAHNMQSLARDYEPAAAVRGMDVFHCTPLAAVAQSRAEWLERHLGRWTDFCADVKFHEVDGEHYTMLNKDHVDEFCKMLNATLAARGL